MTVPATSTDRNTVTSTTDGIVILTTAADTITIDVTDDDWISFTNVFSATATINWTGSLDGVTFFQITPFSNNGGVIVGGSTATSGQFLTFACTPFNFVKITLSATTGTATLQWKTAKGDGAQGGFIAQIIPGTSATALGKAEDAAHASGDVGVEMLGVRRDQLTAVQTNADGDYSFLATNSGGVLRATFANDANIIGPPTQHRLISAATANPTSMKGSGGNIYKIMVGNTNAAIRYLKFYNSASAPTPGAGTPVLVLELPASSMQDIDFQLCPMPFATGIAYDMVTGALDADATAVAAGDIHLCVLYA